MQRCQNKLGIITITNFKGLDSIFCACSLWPLLCLYSRYLPGLKPKFWHSINMYYFEGSTGHHVRSGSPANCQNPDCPETVFTLKMESVFKNTFFGQEMIVKSGLEKIFLKFLHVGDYFLLLHKSAQRHKFSNKNNYLPAWRDFKINFSRPHFTIIFRPKNLFLDTDSILSHEGKNNV